MYFDKIRNEVLAVDHRSRERSERPISCLNTDRMVRHRKRVSVTTVEYYTLVRLGWAHQDGQWSKLSDLFERVGIIAMLSTSVGGVDLRISRNGTPS